MSIIFNVSERQYLCCLLELNLLPLLSSCSKELCKEWRPCCFLSSRYSMNSISLGARFTEPTRENKDALIKNNRGEKVIAVVNELNGCLWVGYGSCDEKRICSTHIRKYFVHTLHMRIVQISH